MCSSLPLSSPFFSGHFFSFSAINFHFQSLIFELLSWELMSGLDADNFRFSPIIKKDFTCNNKENSNSNLFKSFSNPLGSEMMKCSLDKFEKLCPPNRHEKVVIYTTTLRGIRETCNAVRSVIAGFEVSICKRDVSMDHRVREELKELMRGKSTVPPKVFVKGRYIGGVEEVMRIVEEGKMGELLQGLQKKKVGDGCDGCGDVRFLPCFSCNGSSKLRGGVLAEAEEEFRRYRDKMF